MKKIIPKIFVFLCFIWAVILPKAARAVGVGICPNGQDTCGDYDYVSYLKDLYGFAIRLGGTAATLMIIYAGFIYLTSQGDTSKLNQAKEIVFSAILGFIFLLTIGMILNFIGLPSFDV